LPTHLPLLIMKIELSHDILAKKVYEKASSEDRMRLKIEQFVHQRFAYFQQRGALLGAEDINYVQPYLPLLIITPEELAFIKKSKSATQRKFIVGAVVVGVFIVVILILWMRSAATARDLEAKQIQIEKQALAIDSISREREARADAEVAAVLDKNTLAKTLKAARDSLYLLTQQLEADKQSIEAVKNKTDKNVSTYLGAESKAAFNAGDKNKAYQLAKEAWNFDKSNNDACLVISKIDNANVKWTDKVSSTQVESAIQRIESQKKVQINPIAIKPKEQASTTPKPVDRTVSTIPVVIDDATMKQRVNDAPTNTKRTLNGLFRKDKK